MLVMARCEVCVGATTASGYVVDSFVPFVALPSSRALGRFVRLLNPLNGRRCLAVVLDVGPWNTRDNDYVFCGGRPQAETGIDLYARKTDFTGIDLGPAVCSALDIVGDSSVDWRFITDDDV